MLERVYVLTIGKVINRKRGGEKLALSESGFACSVHKHPKEKYITPFIHLAKKCKTLNVSETNVNFET